MKTFDLKPIGNEKSFYGKAVVVEHINSLAQVKSTLKSYNTTVAEYNHDTNEMKVFGYYSATTARHINAFLDFYGFDTCTKQELNNYNKK